MKKQTKHFSDIPADEKGRVQAIVLYNALRGAARSADLLNNKAAFDTLEAMAIKIKEKNEDTQNLINPLDYIPAQYMTLDAKGLPDKIDLSPLLGGEAGIRAAIAAMDFHLLLALIQAAADQIDRKKRETNPIEGLMKALTEGGIEGVDFGTATVPKNSSLGQRLSKLFGRRGDDEDEDEKVPEGTTIN